MTKLDESTHWSVDGSLSSADGGVVTGDKMDVFIDEFCVLAEKHDLRFNGGWAPLTQAQIDGEEE
jgi:hypothetical protein